MSRSEGKPAIDAILQKLLDAAPLQLVGDDGVEAARKRLRDVRVPPEMLPDLGIDDRTLHIDEERAIALRVYWPPEAGEGAHPVIMFFHGGGFALGDLDTHDALSRMHAIGGGAVVVSVEYRLAPEHPYPAAVEGCLGRDAVGRRARRRVGGRSGSPRGGRRFGGRQPGRGGGAAGPRRGLRRSPTLPSRIRRLSA